jgi:hypothetical protein
LTNRLVRSNLRPALKGEDNDAGDPRDENVGGAETNHTGAQGGRGTHLATGPDIGSHHEAAGARPAHKGKDDAGDPHDDDVGGAESHHKGAQGGRGTHLEEVSMS